MAYKIKPVKPGSGTKHGGAAKQSNPHKKLPYPVKVFIASSSLAWKQGRVEPFANELRRIGAKPVPWYDAPELKTTGTTFDALVDKLSYDFALIIFTPDDRLIPASSKTRITAKTTTVPTVRDNVLFEFGLFLGALSRDRVFAIVENSDPSHIPSDLSGVTIPRFKLVKKLNANPKLTRMEMLEVRNALKGLRDALFSSAQANDTMSRYMHQVGLPDIAPERIEEKMRGFQRKIINESSRIIFDEICKENETPFYAQRSYAIVEGCAKKLENIPDWTRIDGGKWLAWTEIRLRALKHSLEAITYGHDAGEWLGTNGHQYLDLCVETMRRLKKRVSHHPVQRAFVCNDIEELRLNCNNIREAMIMHVKKHIPVYLIISDQIHDDIALYDDKYLSTWVPYPSPSAKQGSSNSSRNNKPPSKIHVYKVEWSTETHKIKDARNIWDDIRKNDMIHTEGGVNSRVAELLSTI